MLILHTHTTESYTRTDEPYTESAAWRTADENYNMVSIGDTVSRILGIRVSNVKVRLSRGRQMLKATLQEVWDDE